MYANPFDVSCKLWKELDAVVTVTNTSLQNRSCCAQTFKYPFILPLPSLLRSDFDYPIHYAQPIITPSIIFSLQLPHPLYAAYNYPHPLYSAFNYPIHYIQPTITPFIMFGLQLPHSLCTAYNYPIYGTQWHPEKNAFFWNPRFVINHSKRAVKAAEYFARFFVREGEFCFEKERGRERELRVCVRACVHACVREFVRVCGFV